jgi:SAM-dependent methyltransferase
MNNNLNLEEVSGLRNAFGLPILTIQDLLADEDTAEVIRLMGRNVFRYLGISEEKSDEVMSECLIIARTSDDETIYEPCAHALLALEGITKVIPEKLLERADIIHSQIKPFLINGSVLDLGCGDARVAQLLAKDGFKVEVADVYKNSYVDEVNLPFKLLDQNGIVPYNDNQFDNILLITVLHHCNDPVFVFKEAHRVTRPGGRVLIIESVYGVNGLELKPAQAEQCRQYFALTPEKQRRVNIFFDNFYNRVIYYSSDPAKKVNVPYNFNTPELWKQHFEQAGFRQDQIIHLGLDQPAVPEFHTLHILTVIK